MSVPSGRLARMACAALAILLVAVTTGCGDDDAESSPGSRVIAFLRTVATEQTHQDAFLASLREAGYVEGENLTVLSRDPAEVHVEPDDIARTLADWRTRGVDLIVAQSSSAALAAREAGGDAAILFISSEPVAAGLVDDERSPEGRMTGVAFRVPADRTLDLTRRAVPALTTVGFLYAPADPPAAAQLAAMEEAAAAFDLRLVPTAFSTAAEVGPRVGELVAAGVGALVVANTPSAVRVLDDVEAAAGAARIPVVANTQLADFAVLVLEPDVAVLWEQLGRQAVRLLQGSSPADVPVEDPAAFRIVVNLRAAAAAGVDVPASLVEEADSVTR